jgi:tetratricopeptide (TPR) repeat protein
MPAATRTRWTACSPVPCSHGRTSGRRRRTRGRTWSALEILDGAELGDRPLLAIAAPIIALFTGAEARGHAMLDELERHPDPWVRAMAPFVRAQMAENMGELEPMGEHLRVAIERFRETGDRWGTAAAMSELASLHMVGGDLTAADADLAETERLMAELGAGSGGGMVLLRRAELRARLGDYEGARALLSGALEESSAQEERLFVLVFLAAVTAHTGDRDEARALRDEALRGVARLRGDRPDHAHQRAIVYGIAARLHAEHGELDVARAQLRDAYQATIEAHDMPIAGRVGEATALVALRLGARRRPRRCWARRCGCAGPTTSRTPRRPACETSCMPRSTRRRWRRGSRPAGPWTATPPWPGSTRRHWTRRACGTPRGRAGRTPRAGSPSRRRSR